MKRTNQAIAGLAAVAVVSGLGFAAVTATAAGPEPTRGVPVRQGGQAGPGWSAPGTNLPAAASTISPGVAADLAFMVQEERLAEDAYTAIADRYDAGAPFTNIARSEQQHQDAVAVLLERYGLSDPSAGMAPGTYADPALQKLYDDLMARAEVSLAEAYQVGVAVETTDIADLTDALAADGVPADVRTVFERLVAGSENHLRAFTNAGSGGGLAGGQGGRGQGGWGRTGR